MHSSYTNQPQGALNNSPVSGQEYDDPDRRSGLNLIQSAGFISLGQARQAAKYRLAQLQENKAVIAQRLPHITMIMVVSLVVVLGNLNISWGRIGAIQPLKRAAGETLQAAVVSEETNPPLSLPTQLNEAANYILVRAAVPRTIIPDRTLPSKNRNEIRSYTVASGDTISSIAVKFGLAPETIIWSNPELEDNPDLLSIGQEVIILPVDGVYHQVGGVDTIEKIAGTYKTDPEKILNQPLNNLDPENPVIQAGQWLIVPDGVKPFVPRTVIAYSGPVPDNALAGTGIFGWPASGSISNGFYSWHPGIDIAAWIGAPVLAADSGYVIVAGWDNAYGYHVVIDHGNGFQTLYAHLNSYYVEAGDNIAKGQQIGEMGNTGNSTGPHLHFEVRHGTVQRNPSGFLP
jgi:murein DD-endopeptidase MepM/ murein hydrolase activator NlpD